jgi:hypothetical protein
MMGHKSRIVVHIVGDVTLQSPYRKGVVDFTSTASLLARMIANTTADRNKRIAPADYIGRFIELALSGKCQIFRNIHTCRTRMLARCPHQAFANRRPAGL